MIGPGDMMFAMSAHTPSSESDNTGTGLAKPAIAVSARASSRAETAESTNPSMPRSRSSASIFADRAETSYTISAIQRALDLGAEPVAGRKIISHNLPYNFLISVLYLL
jgi:hypothetical protein